MNGEKVYERKSERDVIENLQMRRKTGRKNASG